MSLDEYLKKFSRLNTDKSLQRWSEATCHRAPHKPFLLLSIMDLIAQGQITENFIEPSFELVDTWNGYWQAIMPINKHSTMAYPFPRLQSDGFWHRVANPGYDADADYNVSSMARLREIYAGARLDDHLFALLMDPVTRELLRSTLIQTYFAADVQPFLEDQAFVNLAAFTYASDVIAGIKESTERFAQESPEIHRVRDQGFRRAIVTLYDHRCALCGIRMRTPEGHTVVEAAHIVPWSESHDDLPANGLCLCRLCHWSFDEGLMSVGRQYEVLVSDRVRIDSNMPGHVLTLKDRPILKPDAERFWPGQENLTRHRSSCFV
jgi:putative restriction endonuclease